jgi:hypothetical protein
LDAIRPAEAETAHLDLYAGGWRSCKNSVALRALTLLRALDPRTFVENQCCGSAELCEIVAPVDLKDAKFRLTL